MNCGRRKAISGRGYGLALGFVLEGVRISRAHPGYAPTKKRPRGRFDEVTHPVHQ